MTEALKDNLNLHTKMTRRRRSYSSNRKFDSSNLQFPDFYLTRRRISFTFSLPGQRIATEVARAGSAKKNFSLDFSLENKYSPLPPRLIYSVAECVRTTNENGQALTYFPDFPAIASPPLQGKFPPLTLVIY